MLGLGLLRELLLVGAALKLGLGPLMWHSCSPLAEHQAPGIYNNNKNNIKHMSRPRFARTVDSQSRENPSRVKGTILGPSQRGLIKPKQTDFLIHLY